MVRAVKRNAYQMNVKRINIKYISGILYIASIYCMVLSAGCSNGLKSTAYKLKMGMTTNDVYALFKKYDVLGARTGNIAHMNPNAIMYRTNIPIYYRITFIPKNGGIFNYESCKIYFDENGYIIGYYYERPD